MKIAILHDYFQLRGGGERLIINLARAIKADIYTGFVDRKNTFDMADINVTEIGRKIRNPLLRTIYLMEKFKRLELKGYDFFIFSGTICISAARHKPNLLYLHTPPRHLYDLREWFFGNTGFMERLGLRLLHWYLYPRDQRYMRQFDMICPNSNNVKNRVKRFYGEDLYDKCKVVYTGIETKKFYSSASDFFLSVSRLDKLKRIDIMINAFKQLPEEKLYITSAGPEEQRLRKLAEGATNIQFLGAVSDERLLELLAGCKAVISANVDEDLGLSAIECQAAGKPAITVREGGFLETVIDGRTGMFFEPNTESLVSAIKKFNSIEWGREEIRANAAQYDIGVFVERIRSIIDSRLHA